MHDSRVGLYKKPFFYTDGSVYIQTHLSICTAAVHIRNQFSYAHGSRVYKKPFVYTHGSRVRTAGLRLRATGEKLRPGVPGGSQTLNWEEGRRRGPPTSTDTATKLTTRRMPTKERIQSTKRSKTITLDTISSNQIKSNLFVASEIQNMCSIQ